MLSNGPSTVATPISNGRTHGWFTAGRRGGMFEGRAIAFHRGGDGQPKTERHTAVIMGPDVSIGIDDQGGQRIQWARIGDLDLPLEELKMTLHSNGGATLDFRPALDLEIDLRPTGVQDSSDAFERLLPPERWIAERAGLRGNREIFRTRAQFTHDGKEYTVNGFTLRVD